jgi:glycosyltransferase involved in cell wall biosynthesis
VRTLLFSTLYPSRVRPRHGLFVEKRAIEVARHAGLRTEVVAPVPWVPRIAGGLAGYSAMVQTPRHETWHGMQLHHPRYFLLPRIGMNLAPATLAWGARGCLARLVSEGFDFDVIDAHYLYPDGVAAALLGRWFGKPVILTARGSDVNLIAGFAVPRAMMRWAVRTAFASIGVSADLANKLVGLGAREVHVMRNGVDCAAFQPMDPDLARRRLGLSDGPWLLSVGNLVPLKRHAWIIESLAELRIRFPSIRLAIVGAGELGGELAALAGRLGLADHVRLVGSIDQAELAWWYSAAHVSVLASEREGWPNVLLESMACGTPVVAAQVGGVPEIVGSPDLGLLFDPSDRSALTTALRNAIARTWDRHAVRAHAQRMGWDETSRKQAELFERAVVQARRGFRA